VIRLPAALHAWAPWLSLFAEPLALELGPWVARLAPALGSLRRVSLQRPGEPDGYRGLSRRGPYERLVAGEWALAEVVPEEFLRRAAHGEHLFLELASAEPAGALRSVALFDAGPSQLGAPRIVHLATLIALAQRAEGARASFAWGVLQQRSLFETVTPENVRLLLQARTAQEATAGDLDFWQTQLGPLAESDDRWVVGPTRLRGQVASGFCPSFVEVRDPYDPERLFVLAVVRHRAEPAKEIELGLPDPASCAQLLRDPFRVAGAVLALGSTRLDRESNLMFSASQKRLLTRLGSQNGSDVIGYAVPNSQRDRAGRPKMFFEPDGAPVTAAGWYRRRLVTVASTAEALLVYGLGSQEGLARPLLRLDRAHLPDFVAAGSGQPLQPCVVRPSSGVPEAFFLDAAGHLIRVFASAATPPEILASGVLGFCQAPRFGTAQFFYAVPAPAQAGLGPGVSVRTGPYGNELARVGVEEGAPATVHFGGGVLAAIGHRPGAWTLVNLSLPRSVPQQTDTLETPSGAEVVGLAADGSLVLLDADRHTLRLHGKTDLVLTRSAASIETACVSGFSDRVAYRTAAGEIVVHAFGEDAPLLRIVPEAKP
jgi:hypothetical protein